MALLLTLTNDDIGAAIRRVNEEGVPAGRGSTKFCLALAGRHYPPKYVVALAARRALGRDLRPDEFSGGTQANGELERLGFEVIACSCRGTLRTRQPSPAAAPTRLAPQPRPTKPILSNGPAADQEALIVRIVAGGRTPDDPCAVAQILLDTFRHRWSKRMCAKFVLTPGGFVRGNLPASWRGRSGWESRDADLRGLVAEAERQLARVVTARVYEAATGKAAVLTIGIDLFSPSAPEHAELVAVCDVSKRAVVRWTGKSYPTGSQERTLVHVADVKSHLVEIADERVLVLGCHDLNMWSPRGHANQSPDGPRRARCDAMRRAARAFKPTVVLQHPHSTDTPNIWRMPWLSLARELPTVRAWASGIAYYSWNGPPRAGMDRVLNLTRSSADDVRDLVVDVDA